jgi:hypothetical protein
MSLDVKIPHRPHPLKSGDRDHQPYDGRFLEEKYMKRPRIEGRSEEKEFGQRGKVTVHAGLIAPDSLIFLNLAVKEIRIKILFTDTSIQASHSPQRSLALHSRGDRGDRRLQEPPESAKETQRRRIPLGVEMTYGRDHPVQHTPF